MSPNYNLALAGGMMQPTALGYSTSGGAGFNPSAIEGTIGLSIHFDMTRAQFVSGNVIAADADDDVINDIRDQGDMVLPITISGAHTLQSDATMGSYLQLVNGNGNIAFVGSKAALRHLHTNKTWDLCFWVNVATLQACTYFDSKRRTSAATGITIELQVGGTTRCTIANGTGLVYSLTSTAVLPTSDWVMIRATHTAGSAPTLQLFTDNGQTAGSVENWVAGPQSYAANGTDSTDDLVFGSASNSTATNVYDDSLGMINLKLDALFSDDDITNMRNWRAARNNTPYVLVTKGTYADRGARAVSGLISHHDFSDTTKLWQDSVGGTAADDAGERVAVVEPQWDGVADSTLNRNMTASADDRPTYVAAATTGLDVGGCQWNGETPNNLTFPTSWNLPGAQITVVILARNTKTATDDASRIMTDTGSIYFVQTPNNYLGTGGDCRAVLHTSTGNTKYGQSGGVGETLDGESFNIYEILRDETSMWVAVNGDDADPTTDSGVFDPIQSGEAEQAGTAWNFTGEAVAFLAFNGLLSPEQRTIIRDGLTLATGFTAP